MYFTLFCYLIQYPTAQLTFTHRQRKVQDISTNNFVQLTNVINNHTMFRYNVLQFHCILSQNNDEQLSEYLTVKISSCYGIRRFFYNITRSNVSYMNVTQPTYIESSYLFFQYSTPEEKSSILYLSRLFFDSSRKRSLLHWLPTNTVSCKMGNASLATTLKRPGRGADHPPLLALGWSKGRAIPLPLL